MKTLSSKDEVLKAYILLRASVCYLGEKHHAGWWDSSLLDETGFKFLSYNFPRTAVIAGVHGATEAAKKVHDNRLGTKRVFHLFRLPFALEEEIHHTILDLNQEEMTAVIDHDDAAYAYLQKVTDSSIDAPEGPVQVGSLKDIEKERGLAEMAKHYTSAFMGGFFCLPYFRE